MKINSCQVYDQACAQYEHSLNRFGYCPIVSSVSGFVRGVAGTAQIIAGLAGAIYRGGQAITSGKVEYKILALENVVHIVHGYLNTVRGSIEAFPVLGNLMVCIYDHVVQLRVNYTFEKVQGKTPLLPQSTDFETYFPQN